MFGYRNLFNHEVYILFSNHHLYTMKKKEYEDGEIDKDKLIRNKININCISHFIIFPKFEYHQIKCLKIESIEE